MSAHMKALPPVNTSVNGAGKVAVHSSRASSNGSRTPISSAAASPHAKRVRTYHNLSGSEASLQVDKGAPFAVACPIEPFSSQCSQKATFPRLPVGRISSATTGAMLFAHKARIQKADSCRPQSSGNPRRIELCCPLRSSGHSTHDKASSKECMIRLEPPIHQPVIAGRVLPRTPRCCRTW